MNSNQRFGVNHQSRRGYAGIKNLIHLFIFIIALTCGCIFPVCADPLRLAILEFQIRSADPMFLNTGKGIAEMFATEFAYSPEIEVVERQERNRVFQELGINPSGAKDITNLLQAGQRLETQYLVAGDAVIARDSITLHVSVIETGTGVVVFQYETKKALEQYAFALTTCAVQLFQFFGADVPDNLNMRYHNPREKPVEFLVMFSDAIDAMDRNDPAAARNELMNARTLDPGDETVNAYLSKLVLNPAKFEIVIPPYFPATNPAQLGIIPFDAMYLRSLLARTPEHREGIPFEADIRVAIGYQTPLAENFGIGVELAGNSFNDLLDGATDEDEAEAGRGHFMGIFSFGWAPSDTLSLGLSLSLIPQYIMEYNSIAHTTVTNILTGGFGGAVSIGLLIKNPESSLIYDVLAGFPFDTRTRINETTMELYRVQAPVFLGNSLVVALFDHTFFFVLKQINDIYYDRLEWNSSLVVGIEYWPVFWLGIQAAAETNFAMADSQTRWGAGSKAGFTIRIPGTGWGGWDITLDCALRQRSSRIVADAMVYEIVPSFSISKTGSFGSRPSLRIREQPNLRR
ncbi:MAG: hypothetical protein JW904_07655 [Spirochaetales bacterium]|nr:hypothetical protein [Spirochaetales bacterium]